MVVARDRSFGVISHAASPRRDPNLSIDQNRTLPPPILELIEIAGGLGCISVSYHLALQFKSLKNSPSLTFSCAGTPLSSGAISKRYSDAVGICHDYVLKKGQPVALSTVVPRFLKLDAGLTTEIMSKIAGLGIGDEYMVPVYGSFGANAIISYGFRKAISAVEGDTLRILDERAQIAHAFTIRDFLREAKPSNLSQRERTVLRWIARGKAGNEIAEILSIRSSSVDTYTRRIFQKLGVNDRVSAAVMGLVSGQVTL